MHLYELISEMPMFEHFSDEEKKMFAEMKHSVAWFKNGETIISEGEESFSIFLLITGSCFITKKQEDSVLQLSKIKPGELFGEMSFFTKSIRETNVVASGDVTVMKMDEGFFKMVNPDVKDKIKDYFIELLIERLNKMNASIVRISKLISMHP